MEKQRKSISPQRKAIGRKDKERLKQLKKLQLQQERQNMLKQQADIQLSRLKSTGLVNAYESFLRSLLINGLPQQSILYQKAAQFVLQYEKKKKKKIEKQQNFESKASEILKKSRSRSNSRQSLSKNIQKSKKQKKQKKMF